ncbi:beta family protein [Seleniivibrio woodruffii]|uniref:beta family protein n=1 Tax=Seleniivibrio woodruffii TaxID=1078050 RepID=UPI0024092DF9|nr:beta family protein [Seleniivibrio woodruffii]
MQLYNLLFKTGAAEIRAVNNINVEDTKYIRPIIEVTRGRKTKSDNIGDSDKKIISLLNFFKKSPEIIFDITSDFLLSNSLIDSLFFPDDGYKKWCDFCLKYKEHHKGLVPVLQINPDDSSFSENLFLQAKKLLTNFEKICYRSDMLDFGFEDDLSVISDLINDNNLLIVLDCGYMDSSFHWYADKVRERIDLIKSIFTDVDFVVTATSFPKSVSDVGHENYDSFKLSEIELYNKLAEEYPKLGYGDYGSVNPVRNDMIARGWIPRIDVPLDDRIYYRRLRKQKEDESYSTAYRRISEMLIEDKQYPRHLKCWGIDCINSTASGEVAGSSPSFWISVRMNIHIKQRINHISSKL